MQIYKVGGAVRDRLLGRPVTDIDWGAPSERAGAATAASPSMPAPR